MMSYLGKFSAALSARRVSIKDDGNTEVYSNNESFHEGVLWKLSILTPKPDNEFEVTGQIEKLQDGVPVPFELEEAKSAIYGTFFQVSKVTVYETMKPGKTRELYVGAEVAFTLRAGDEEQCKALKQTEHINETIDDCLIETGKMSLVERVSNVHGLLTLNKVIPLEDCAQ